MGTQGNPAVLIVGGDTEEAIRPPNMNILFKFPAMSEVPFDLNDEDEVAKQLYDKYGQGYYRVYSPGHAQRMRTWFKGWVDKRDKQFWRRNRRQ